MGLVFSESTNKTGIVELLEDLTGQSSAATGAYSLAKKTRDINSALAQFMLLALQASGKVQVDDTNQTDYPILKINIVQGQRDYPVSVDGSSNQVLAIQKVARADASGNFQVIPRYDQTDELPGNQPHLLDTTQGIPTQYDELAGSIFFDKLPSYSYANGLYVWVARTATYFLSTDTTKKPGIPDMFHEYLAYRPAYLYAVSKLPKIAPGYLAFLQKMEQDIQYHYAFKNGAERRGMRAQRDNNGDR